MKIAEPAEEPAAFFFHLASTIRAIDGDDGAAAWSRKRHLDLFGIVVIVRRRRPKSQLLPQALFDRGLIWFFHQTLVQGDLRLFDPGFTESEILVIQGHTSEAKQHGQSEPRHRKVDVRQE